MDSKQQTMQIESYSIVMCNVVMEFLLVWFVQSTLGSVTYLHGCYYP
jgi:hypothetical protein